MDTTTAEGTNGSSTYGTNGSTTNGSTNGATNGAANGSATNGTHGARAPHDRMRCSDAEREQATAVVHEAVGEGRLSMDEAEERLDLVYKARYRDELAALMADLPAGARSGSGSSAAGGWSAIWSALRTQLAIEAAIIAGRHPASWQRRVAALAGLLGPLLVILAGVLLVLHGIADAGPGGGFDHGLQHGFRGDEGNALPGAGSVGT